MFKRMSDCMVDYVLYVIWSLELKIVFHKKVLLLFFQPGLIQRFIVWPPVQVSKMITITMAFAGMSSYLDCVYVNRFKVG